MQNTTLHKCEQGCNRNEHENFNNFLFKRFEMGKHSWKSEINTHLSIRNKYTFIFLQVVGCFELSGVVQVKSREIEKFRLLRDPQREHREPPRSETQIRQFTDLSVWKHINNGQTKSQ